MQVQIVVFDGVEELDAFGPLEVFAAARAVAGAPIETTLVALGGPPTVAAAFGTVIAGPSGWSPGDADVLVVPGGGYLSRVPVGAWAEISKGELPSALLACPRDGLTMAGVCTGVMLLAAAGLTAGRPCTTHPQARDALIGEGGMWVDSRVVDDGDLVTCGGVTSGLDLALWLVEREHGPGVAAELERYLHYERRGTAWRGPASHGARTWSTNV